MPSPLLAASKWGGTSFDVRNPVPRNAGEYSDPYLGEGIGFETCNARRRVLASVAAESFGVATDGNKILTYEIDKAGDADGRPREEADVALEEENPVRAVASACRPPAKGAARPGESNQWRPASLPALKNLPVRQKTTRPTGAPPSEKQPKSYCAAANKSEAPQTGNSNRTELYPLRCESARGGHRIPHMGGMLNAEKTTINRACQEEIDEHALVEIHRHSCA